MRTGNRDAREAVPARISIAKAQAAEHRDNQARARAKLNVVATERTQLLQKLARLDKLDSQLLQVVDEREKLRKSGRMRPGHSGQMPNLPRFQSIPTKFNDEPEFCFEHFGFVAPNRRLLKRLGCLYTASLVQLGVWADLDGRIAKLTSQLQAARR